MSFEGLRRRRTGDDNVIAFPVRQFGSSEPAKTKLTGQSHGWTIEAMRDYHIRPSVLSLQEQFDKEISDTYKNYGPDKGGDIERMNIAARYAEYTDDIGGYLVEGVSDYIWTDEDEYGYGY